MLSSGVKKLQLQLAFRTEKIPDIIVTEFNFYYAINTSAFLTY